MSQGKRLTTQMLVRVGILSALSFILSQFKFPLPLIPPWLTINVGLLPALLGGFALGPLGGCAIAVITQLLHLLQSHTGGVGELADVLMGISFVFPASLLYARSRTLRTAIVGMAIGIACMCVVGALSNVYILIPLFTQETPFEGLIAGAASKNAMITDMTTYVVYAVLPFNLIKGLLISAIALLSYKRLSPLLSPARRGARAMG